MKRWIGAVAVVVAFSLLGGCASVAMQANPAASYSPTRDKALIIFLRPSSFGGAIQSTVFDVNQKDKNEFIGIVSSKTKIAYLTEPGEKLFMVIGENADFMNATLEAGKTYYALVSPRMGFWKARFSLFPIHNDTTSKYRTESDEFKDWMSSTQYVENTEASRGWYEANKLSVLQKKEEYLQKWNRMAPADKALLTLKANDGK
jgi:uncharacterized protein YceK